MCCEDLQAKYDNLKKLYAEAVRANNRYLTRLKEVGLEPSRRHQDFDDAIQQEGVAEN